jgi:hypothetical protein
MFIYLFLQYDPTYWGAEKSLLVPIFIQDMFVHVLLPIVLATLVVIEMVVNKIKYN